MSYFSPEQSGIGSAKNYILNPQAEVDTLGWATYADAAGASPVDGTGGAPTETFTRSTTSPLRGAASFLLTKDAVNRQGEGASYAFTIDSVDKAKPIQISFDYVIASGTYSGGTSSTDSDLTVYLYDVTNAIVIQPAAYKIDGGVVSTNYNFNGVFQTSSNSTSYRLIIHTATTSASAYTVKIDNFYVGPQKVGIGAVATDWVAYTPTFGAGFGTAASISFFSRRVGDTLQIRGKFTAGTTTGSAATFTAGYAGANANVTFDSAKGTVSSLCGNLSQGDSSTTLFHYSVLTPSANGSSTIQIGVQTSSTSETTVTTGSSFSTSDIIHVECQLPITGWSSNVQMSNDTDTRVVAARAYAQNISITSGAQINYSTVDFDTHGAITTGASWKFTVPVPGIYKVSSSIYSVTTTYSLTVYKNGAADKQLGGTVATTGVPVASGSVLVKCVAGDTIDLRTNANITTINDTTGSWVSIERLSGPSQIAASESVTARYYASATAISGTLATISWTTKDFDSHGGMSAGTYTVPAAGKYRVASAVALAGTFVLNNTSIMEIQKNGSAISNNTQYIAAAVTNDTIRIEDTISCVAGDTLRIQVSNSGTTPSIVSSNTRNYIAIERVGN